MTEAEIMKALELCHTMDGSVSCYDCPCWNYERQKCDGFDHTDLLDLLNRKNAEIEQLYKTLDYRGEKITELESEIKRLEKAIQVQEFMLENQDYKIKKAMGGAIESFAERLKKCFCNFPLWGKISVDFIDQIAKEMGVEL